MYRALLSLSIYHRYKKGKKMVGKKQPLCPSPCMMLSIAKRDDDRVMGIKGRLFQH